MVVTSTRNLALSFSLLTGFHSGLVWAEEGEPETASIADGTATIPPEGRPLIDWVWRDQIKPTLENADDKGNLWIFAGTTVASVLARQKDTEFHERYGDNQGMSQKQSMYGAVLGSGFPGILIAAGQLYYDTGNGLQHARALGFTSLTHITTAVAVQRKRPNGKNLSFPSGHTSSSFATATSLAYSYGPWVGLPAIAAATYIGFSRPANNSHWLSDIVAGAGLGIFWARASFLVNKKSELANFYPTYTFSESGPGLGIGYEKKF